MRQLFDTPTVFFFFGRIFEAKNIRNFTGKNNYFSRVNVWEMRFHVIQKYLDTV